MKKIKHKIQLWNIVMMVIKKQKLINMRRNKQKFEEIFIWNYFMQIIYGLKA